MADDRGRGYSNLYFDMKNKINEISSTFRDFEDPRVNWEYLKFKMRQFSKFTVKQLSKSRKKAREKLVSKIENFEKNEDPSQDEFAAYEEAKKEVENIYDHITDGIILWSKAQWYEMGEKASKYFLTLEKQKS